MPKCNHGLQSKSRVGSHLKHHEKKKREVTRGNGQDSGVCLKVTSSDSLGRDVPLLHKCEKRTEGPWGALLQPLAATVLLASFNCSRTAIPTTLHDDERARPSTAQGPQDFPTWTTWLKACPHGCMSSHHVPCPHATATSWPPCSVDFHIPRQMHLRHGLM